MAVMRVPSLMRDLTGGCREVRVTGRTVREALDALESRYPGVRSRLCRGSELVPGLRVLVDGAPATRGLATPVGERSEIVFVPAIGGG